MFFRCNQSFVFSRDLGTRHRKRRQLDRAPEPGTSKIGEKRTVEDRVSSGSAFLGAMIPCHDALRQRAVCSPLLNRGGSLRLHERVGDRDAQDLCG